MVETGILAAGIIANLMQASLPCRRACQAMLQASRLFLAGLFAVNAFSTKAWGEMNVIKPVISETSESRVSEAKQETYYMVLFASQTPVWRKPKAHCFASFVRVPAAGEDGEREEPEIHTISWYPAAGRCRVIHPPEEGVNSALDITIERCKKARMNLYKWGPVQIKKEFYDKAVLRASQLHAGELRWQALDKSTRRQGVAVNCIHALSDLDIENGYVEFGLCSGRSAAEQMARMFSKWVISPETKHDFVCEVLGICHHEITDLEP